MSDREYRKVNTAELRLQAGFSLYKNILDHNLMDGAQHELGLFSQLPAV